MKILVIGKNASEENHILSGLKEKYDVVFSEAENALAVFLTESPKAVIGIAEYEGDPWLEARQVLTDIKLLAKKDVIFLRLGFLKEEPVDGEKYLRLPVSLNDILSLVSKVDQGEPSEPNNKI